MGRLRIFYEIKPDQFEMVLPIFVEQLNQIAIESIAQGNTFGRAGIL